VEEQLLNFKCLNVDEILDKHRSYWEERGAVVPVRAHQKNTKGDDDSDEETNSPRIVATAVLVPATAVVNK
jgi:hypothetical protein